MIHLGRLVLNNPICLAPGAYCGQDLTGVGAVFTKTVTYDSRAGNAGVCFVDLGNGSAVNRMGLPNVGIRDFIQREFYDYYRHGIPVVVSIQSPSSDQLKELASLLEFSLGDKLAAIEINLSCPNVWNNLSETTLERDCKAVQAGLEVTPFLIKLPPELDKVGYYSHLARCCGAVAVSAVNTVKAVVKHEGSWIEGGLSGESLKPIAQRCVRELVQRGNLPVIAVGGVSTRQDVEDYLELGAVAVQIGTAEILNPGTVTRLARELNEV